jgi:hypothetical protein
MPPPKVLPMRRNELRPAWTQSNSVAQRAQFTILEQTLEA